MKKLLSVLLALGLMLGCVNALAEAANDERTLETISFGDFTMTLDPEMPGVIYEKAENQPYFKLFPFYDENAEFNANINCVWNSVVEDLTTVDANEFAAFVLQTMISQYEAMNMKAENVQILMAQPDEQDGKYAITYGAKYDLEGNTLYMMQAIVSDAAFGTYSFTVTFADMAQADALGEIVNTIRWAQ